MIRVKTFTFVGVSLVLILLGRGNAFAQQRGIGRAVEAENRREFLRTALSANLKSDVQVRDLERKLDAMSPRQIDALLAETLRRRKAAKTDSVPKEYRQQAKIQQQSIAMARARQELTRARAVQAQFERQLALRRLGMQGNQFLPQFIGPNGAVAPNRGFAPNGAFRPNRGFTPFPRGVIGYQPQIGILPSGATMSARAVVSPDRKYVRINVAAFFSSIPAVHTYNLRTGEMKRIR